MATNCSGPDLEAAHLLFQGFFFHYPIDGKVCTRLARTMEDYIRGPPSDILNVTVPVLLNVLSNTTILKWYAQAHGTTVIGKGASE